MKGDQQRLDVFAAAVDDFARAVVEVQMHELQHVLDLIAAHLALLEPVAGVKCCLGVAPRDASAHEPLGFQIPAYTRIRGALHARSAKRHAQVVVV
jgi:hypothetical protein